ncbi:MAG: carboxypeptidase-like regulatory domain-containing protein [Bryobacteraceae bacterium]
MSRSVETSEAGSYRVFPLNPGTYEVSVTKPGFRSQAVADVVLEVASNVKIDFKLDVGQVTETLNVTATSPMLQTQDASIGGVITTQELQRLPVNGRNYTRLMLLMPGSSDQGSSQSMGAGALSGTQLVSVNGQRRQDNNFTVDGIDNNFMMMNSPGASPPMDSIQEFKVANNTSAEFGRSAGSNINMVIKSGTRDIHGSVYEYFRNDKLDANDFFANRQGRGKVPFRQNQYGVSVGGPVVVPKLFDGRDSTFWFFNWEGFRRRRDHRDQHRTDRSAAAGRLFPAVACDIRSADVSSACRRNHRSPTVSGEHHPGKQDQSCDQGAFRRVCARTESSRSDQQSCEYGITSWRPGRIQHANRSQHRPKGQLTCPVPEAEDRSCQSGSKSEFYRSPDST